MTVQGISITDGDSLMAAADLLEPYGNYCARLADELAEENGWTVDDWDEDGFHPHQGNDDEPDPEPPTPAAPALRLLPPSAPCPTCHGSGAYPNWPTMCWYCAGSGVDHFAANPAPAVANDRTEHLRRIGQTGGMVTYERYGSVHMRIIGKAGYQAAVDKYGRAYVQDILRARGWTPRKPDLLSDLRTGRRLAELAAA